jgi:hypothetical protein
VKFVKEFKITEETVLGVRKAADGSDLDDADVLADATKALSIADNVSSTSHAVDKSQGSINSKNRKKRAANKAPGGSISESVASAAGATATTANTTSAPTLTTASTATTTSAPSTNSATTSATTATAKKKRGKMHRNLKEKNYSG